MPLIPYSLKEGLAGFRRAKFAVFTSTSAMAVALVLIGLFGLLSYEAQLVSDWLRQRVGELEVFLVDDIDAQAARALHERAQATFGVAGADYISTEQAVLVARSPWSGFCGVSSSISKSSGTPSNVARTVCNSRVM